MNRTPRHLLAAGAALLALGAAVTPALATTAPGGRTPAAQDILALQPQLQIDVGPMHTVAQARRTRVALLANETASRHAASIVSHAQAGPTQLTGRADWVAGVRDEVTADREYAYAAKLVIEGRPAQATRKANEAYRPQMAGDVDIVHGDRLMGLARTIGTIEHG
jgi:hypothetical protein